MKKKRLLFINGHLNTGGVEKSLLDILTHLDYETYEVDLLLTEELGDYASQLPSQVNVILRSLQGTYGSLTNVILTAIRNRDWFSLKMRLIRLAMRLFGNEKIIWAKNLLTGNREYDCVIGFRRGICTQIAANAVNAKRIITWWHHGTVNVDTEDYLREVENCDQIVAVSAGCRDMLIQAMPSLGPRLITIHNILDVEQIRKNADFFDPYKHGEGLQIVSVGHLHPEKHFDDAIYAAGVLKDKGIVFQWHLIGDGPMRAELQKLVADTGVSDCFLFEGNQVNPYPYIKQADLFVHPSRVESFGIVVTEALALGRPCVVTKSTGVLDFLKDGENALLAELDRYSLAEKVTQILEDEDLRRRIANGSRCPEQFLPEAVMKKIDDLMENSV